MQLTTIAGGHEIWLGWHEMLKLRRSCWPQALLFTEWNMIPIKNSVMAKPPTLNHIPVNIPAYCIHQYYTNVDLLEIIGRNPYQLTISFVSLGQVDVRVIIWVEHWPSSEVRLQMSFDCLRVKSLSHPIHVWNMSPRKTPHSLVPYNHWWTTPAWSSENATEKTNMWMCKTIQ